MGFISGSKKRGLGWAGMDLSVVLSVCKSASGLIQDLAVIALYY